PARRRARTASGGRRTDGPAHGGRPHHRLRSGLRCGGRRRGPPRHPGLHPRPGRGGRRTCPRRDRTAGHAGRAGVGPAVVRRRTGGRMTFSVRHVLIGLAVAFTAYLSARGLWWTEPVARPVGMIASLVVYLLITWLCLLVEPAGGRRTTPDDHDVPLTAGSRGPVPLPTWAAALAFALAIALPTGLTLFAGTGSAGAPYVTWYIGGIGALMTIVMVRRRTWWAWAGTAALAVVSGVWLGPLNALAMGLVGSVLWVGVAQLLMRSFDRAARDTSQLQELQAAASSWQAAQSGRRRERRVQVQRALTIAGPVLTRAIEVGGAITPADRAEATIAEGRLRDELRGGRLLD